MALTGWNNRLKLIIPCGKISASLTDFPIMIKLGSSVGTNTFDASCVFDELVSDSNRKKIAVTTDDDIQCYVEIEKWSDVDELAVLWVKIPSISYISDTVLYLYYDSTKDDNDSYVGDTGESVVYNVWSNNFVAVWHMSQEPTTVSGILDSTSNMLHGDPQGSMGSGDLLPSPCGDGINFNGTDAFIDIGDTSLVDFGGNNFSISYMSKFDVYMNSQFMIVAKQDGSSGQFRTYWYSTEDSLLYVYTDPTTYFIGRSGEFHFADDDDWHFWHFQRDGNDIEIYVDGEKHGTTQAGTAGDMCTSSAPLTIGKQSTVTPCFFDGTLSEVRIESDSRSDSWVRAANYTCHDNLLWFSDEPVSRWLQGWSNRIKLTIDKDRVAGTLVNFPLNIVLSSGTGINSSDTRYIVRGLATTNSGIIDSYTSLLLQSDGDSSGSVYDKEITAYGDTYISSDNGLELDGTSRYLMVTPSQNDLCFLENDFTVDFLHNNASVSGSDMFVGNWINGNENEAQFKIYADNNSPNKYGVAIKRDGQSYDYWDGETIPSTPSVGVGSTHVALVRDGTNLYLFKSGAKTVLSTTFSGTVDTCNGTGIHIGATYSGTNLINCDISDLRITNGAALWTEDFSFEVPISPLTAGSNTALLLNFTEMVDKSNYSNNMKFHYGQKFSSNNGKFDKAYYFTGGVVSGTFSKVLAEASSNYDFSDGPFTVDWWEYRTSTAANETAIVRKHDGVEESAVCLFGCSDGTDTGVYISSDGASWDISSGNTFGPITLNTLCHYAVVRDDNDNFYLFKNGSITDSFTSSSSIKTEAASDVSIGVYRKTTDVYCVFSGYISDVRFSKGIARWVDDFVPPILPYPNHVEITNDNVKKIAITSYDGITQLPVEVAYWNSNYGAEKAVLFTNVPIVYENEDTDIYLYYDKDRLDNNSYVGYTGEAASYGVWDGVYGGVWHLFQVPTNGSNSILDSTSNQNNGTPAGTWKPSNLINFRDCKALDFVGATNNTGIDCGLDSSLNNFRYFTVEVMVRLDSFGENSAGRIYDKSRNSNEGSLLYVYGSRNSLIQWVDFDGTNGQWEVSPIYLDTEYYITTTHAFTDVQQNSSMYIDGSSKTVSEATTPTGDRLQYDDDNFWIGRNENGVREFNGIISDIRYSSVIRPPEWVSVSNYDRHNNLVTFGSEENNPTYYYEGYVTENLVPVSRLVRIYRRSTGELIASTMSNAFTGYYYLETLYDEEHYVIAFDDEAGTEYNALISDRLDPIGTI